MDSPAEVPIGAEPARWCICFFRETSMPRFDRFFPGRYKHISACGFVAAADAWVFVEPAIAGTRIMVERDGPRSGALVNHWLDQADWLLMPRAEGPPPLLSFLGGWCVPTIARLVGRGYSALSPDGFWRKCKPHAVEARVHEDAVHQAGPGAGSPEKAGAG